MEKLICVDNHRPEEGVTQVNEYLQQGWTVKMVTGVSPSENETGHLFIVLEL